MAKKELQPFLEDRLRVLDPTIDLAPGSPAQLEFIEPVLRYLGTDPFETDIDKFLTDRFRQDFPGIFANDPSAVRDLFVKPLITFLEPFKRETNYIKQSQSFADPSVLSNDDVDALGANFFSDRPSGRFASGVVRVYYSQPTTVSFELTVRFSSKGGIGFFPSVPVSISAEEMVFNREGNLYYADVTVRAEAEGEKYNVDAGEITSYTGLYGVMKVTNPRSMSNGYDQIAPDAFIAQTKASLTERSLNTRRGASARIPDELNGQVRAVQIIGAKDDEMQRDILVGSSPGHAWMTGLVSLYGMVALVRIRTIDSATELPPNPGDTLYVYIPSVAAQAQRTVRLKVEELLSPVISDSGAYQAAYFIRWSGDLPQGVTLPQVNLEGGFIKNATLRVSSLPTVGEVNLEVADGEVHVFGHTDVYVRPASIETEKIVLSNVPDSSPIVERSTLSRGGQANTAVDTDGFDFAAAGVLPGDLLTIESGDNAGTYLVMRAVTSTLYLTSALAKAGSGFRYRISRGLHVDPFDPKIEKLPFANQSANDLDTQPASNLFQFGVNTVDYGVQVGDTVRILSGLDVGDFTITGFDPLLGGRGVLVDRPTGGTGANLKYEIFTKLDPVVRPLVRLKELVLLDATQKSTGVSIPPALPLAVKPTSKFTTAKKKGQSYLRSGFVLPKWRTSVSDPNPYVATSVQADHVQGNDYRYSEDMESTEGGIYKAMEFEGGAQSELLFPLDALESCSYFLATVEDDSLGTNFPPIADPKIGDVLKIKDGPNQGGYLIKRVRKFKYTTGTGPSLKTFWVYFIQIHGEFPVDVFRELITFLDDRLTPDIDKLTGVTAVAFPDFFVDFYNDIGTNLEAALLTLGITPPSASVLQEAAEGVLSVTYEWGSPAKGILRSYFQQPTLFEQNTAASVTPTTYEFETEIGDTLLFRPDPEYYEEHILLPARESADPSVFEYPRDIEIVGPNTASFSTDDKPTMFVLGIQTGDVLSLHQEVLLFSNRLDRMEAVATEQGSAKVIGYGSNFQPSIAGNLLSIEEGDDAGMYRIIDVLSTTELLLDRPITASTPAILLDGVATNWGYSNPDNIIDDQGVDFTGMVGKWITLYTVQADTEDVYWQGSYLITELVGIHRVKVQRTGNFPAYPNATAGRCVVTDAPTVTPAAKSGANSGTGTELVGLRPIRIYQDAPSEFTITSVTASATASTLGVTPGMGAGRRQPYCISRQNIRRITPMEMNDKQEGPFFYFDTLVTSLDCSDEANLQEQSYLVPTEGTYKSQGYRYLVQDKTLTFSMEEELTVELPLRVLPTFSADRSDNYLNVAGAPVQITYDRSDIVQQVQEFLDSVEDRVTSANMLARHFLPAFVSYDARYFGGSTPGIIAQDIVEYIEGIPIETAIDVSMLQKLIDRRGGNPETPTTVSIILHDWQRRVWAEFNENFVGGSQTNVPYDGTPRVSHYLPGKDYSGQETVPYGERINLVRG